MNALFSVLDPTVKNWYDKEKSFSDQYPSIKINLNEEKTKEAVPRKCAVEVPEASSFIKKEALAAVFSGEFCEIFKNTSGRLLLKNKTWKWSCTLKPVLWKYDEKFKTVI